MQGGSILQITFPACVQVNNNFTDILSIQQQDCYKNVTQKRNQMQYIFDISHHTKYDTK